MSIDSRLIDYWLHSREWGYVDRIPTAESTPQRKVKIGHREIIMPESEAAFLAGSPFPIGDEV